MSDQAMATKSGQRALLIMPSRGFGGAELHTIHLAEHLAANAWQCDFCFPLVPDTALVATHAELLGARQIHLPIAFPRATNTQEAMLLQGRILTEGVDLSSYDLIILAAPSPKTVTGMLAPLRESRVPTIVVFHLVAASLTFDDTERSIFLSGLGPNLTLVCVSHFTRDCMATALRVPNAIFEVIENGVETELPDGELIKLDEMLGRPGAPIVMTAARLHQQKGHKVLIDAIPQVLEKVPNAHFVWFGEGEAEETLKEQLAKKQLRSSVSIFGFIDKPYQFYKAATVVAFPTLYEGLSLALLEALQVGSCIVTTDASYQDRLLRHGVDAAIAKAGDASSLANCLIETLTSPRIQQTYRTNAATVGARYTRRIMLNAYDEVIARMIQGPVIMPDLTEPAILRLDLVLPKNTLRISHGESESTVSIQALLSRDHFLALKRDDYRCEIVLRSHGNSHLFHHAELRQLSVEQSCMSLVLDLVESAEILYEQPVFPFWEKLVEVMLSTKSAHAFSAVFPAIDKIIAHMRRFDRGRSPLLAMLLRNLTKFDRAVRFKLIDAIPSLTVGLSAVDQIVLDEIIGRLGGDMLPEAERYRGLRHQANGYDRWSVGHMLAQAPLSGHTIKVDAISRKRVQVFAAHYNFPERNGSDRRISSLIDCYQAMGFEVLVYTLGNPRRLPEAMKAADMLRRRKGVRVEIFRLSEAQQDRYSKLFNELKEGSLHFLELYDVAILLDFYKSFETFKPDIVHINYAYFYWLLVPLANSGVRTILDTHDIQSRRASLFKHIRGLCNKVPEKHEDVSEKLFDASALMTQAFDLAADEELAFSLFDDVLMISEYEHMLVQGRTGSARTHFVPYVPPYVPTPAHWGSYTKALFAGSRNVINILGAAVLARHLVPAMDILPRHTSITAIGDICGALPDSPRIKKAGFVPSVEPIYSSHAIALCPLPAGTGQNIKITEALSRGLPVIAFGSVASAAGLQHGVSGLVANTVEEFCEYTVEILNNAVHLKRLIGTTRDWASHAFCQERFRSLYEDVLKADSETVLN